MGATSSTMLELGTALPAFRLRDLNGKAVTSHDFTGAAGLLVVFLCPHCPFVGHVRAALARLAGEWQARGLAIIGINSNDIAEFPEDDQAGMRKEAAEVGYTFPYLFDDMQEVAQAFRAACTPDFFLFDARLRLVYRGQFDDSRPNSPVPVTGRDLSAAVDALLAGRPAPPDQRPSLGCNIKWKKGAEPEYFRV
ncbi:MAG: thioredoxin family protein [Acidobacteria bacterium]|nr:thioredoxin family protein [Acidobacteriota bacterium]